MKVGFSPAEALALSEAEAGGFLEAWVEMNTPKGGKGSGVEVMKGKGRRLNKNRAK